MGSFGTVNCPHCRVLMDKEELYRGDCFCPYCGQFIDTPVKSDWRDVYYEYLYDDKFSRDYPSSKNDSLAKQEEKEDMVNIEAEAETFLLRFLTTHSFEEVEKSLDLLDGSVDSLIHMTSGPLTEFIEDSKTKVALEALRVKTEGLKEYQLSITFFSLSEEEKKKMLSTFFDAFEICFIRQELSPYIITQNKGLAKQFLTKFGEDGVVPLSMFLSGAEKYGLVSKYFYLVEPFRSLKDEDIMFKWVDDGLISLETILTTKTIPLDTQDFLFERDEVFVSTEQTDPGKMMGFGQILKDCIVFEDPIDTVVKVVSLRSLQKYLDKEEKEDDKDEK